MSDSIRISVDAMGGDKGPRAAVHGARLFWRERKNTTFIFHGRRDRMVIEAVRTAGVPLVITLAGGYARHFEDTVAIHAATIEEALNAEGTPL